MDLTKTGEFIKQQRKLKNLTQAELAQKLNISEKTVSKWECGKGFPDTSLMLPLCEELGISANELLSAKLLSNEEYKNKAEENLVALKNINEKTTKYLFAVEFVLIWFSMVILLGCTIVAAYVELPLVWRILLIVFGFLNIALGVFFSMIIETKAGFYECANCKHKYIPSYKQTVWSIHMGRTRYMKCPKCNKRTWSKKRINNE